MSFAQAEFLLFLGLVVLVWPFLPARGRVPAMLLFSYAFYAAQRPEYLALLVLSTAIDYAVGLALGRTEAPTARKLLLATSLALNLGLLGVFKYAGFVAENLGALSEAAGGGGVAFEGYALPLGISFYTFQTLSYTLDVYARRIAPCRSPLDYALYVSFFPQLVAGPIERARHLLPQLESMPTLRLADASVGVRLIVWGLLKKWVVADALLLETRPVFLRPELASPPTLIVAALAMAIYLYCDFSAYTDIARGSARLFGVQLVKNFDRTFLSTSLHEWARRWHMSLIGWMYDYVWAPLAGSLPGYLALWRANLVVMALFGLWHGASWTFVLWGASYGVLISIEQSWRLWNLRRGRRPAPPRTRLGGALAGSLRWLATVVIASQLMMLFFSPDLEFAQRYLKAELALHWPTGEELRWLLAMVATLLALLVGHAANDLVDLERRWGRLPRVVKALVLALALGIAFRFRAPLDAPFVYFAF
ncbi:MAG: MBOAT family O-acyltransferase [Planctomycetota bacterium]